VVERVNSFVSSPLLEAVELALGFSDPAGNLRLAVERVNIEVQQGDFVCLVGPSGCGKTSVLRALGGFLPAVKGGVLYRKKEVHAPRREIVMIFQEHNLYPWLTVEGNIGFGPRRQGVADAERTKRVDELLAVVGLEDARRQYPHQLSGGMRQRVAIARALATQPDALLLDEPFTALDVILRRRMQSFLRALWQRTRTTMVMVTHDIEEAILVGQRILVMGGHPSTIVESIDTSDEALKDRFGKPFLALQARLENLIAGEEVTAIGEAADPLVVEIPAGNSLARNPT
jgi:ABC-type nitrate/sulfonate/bicarbonate transport system ATPase subunit